MEPGLAPGSFSLALDFGQDSIQHSAPGRQCGVRHFFGLPDLDRIFPAQGEQQILRDRGPFVGANLGMAIEKVDEPL